MMRKMGQYNPDNDNLTRLRALVDQLDKGGDRKVATKINGIIEAGKKDVRKAKDSASKVKCYESIIASISAILMGTKHYV